MELLKIFQNDEHTREAVKKFFFEEMDKYALELVYEEKDTKPISEAKKIIERAFVELKELFDKDKKPLSTNEAR